MNGPLAVMSTVSWSRVMGYASRCLRLGLSGGSRCARVRLREVIVDLAADVQAELASIMTRRAVRSLYRLADRVVAKHLDRHRRRERRKPLRLDDVPEPAAPVPVLDEPSSCHVLEKTPAWGLLRGNRERAIVCDVARGGTFTAISIGHAWPLKEVQRVARELRASWNIGSVPFADRFADCSPVRTRRRGWTGLQGPRIVASRTNLARSCNSPSPLSSPARAALEASDDCHRQRPLLASRSDASTLGVAAAGRDGRRACRWPSQARRTASTTCSTACPPRKSRARSRETGACRPTVASSDAAVQRRAGGGARRFLPAGCVHRDCAASWQAR